MYLSHTETGIGIASLISLGPTIALLYLVLKKYTYPAVEKPLFSDSRLFTLLTIGFLEGTLLSIPLIYLLPSYVKGCSGLKIMLIFGTLTEVTKLVTMNIKKLRGKSDTTFYGFGLGLGMGASIGIKLIYFINKIKVDTTSWVILISAAIQHILIHASTGTVIGEGVAKHQPFKFTTLAIILDIIFQSMMTITFSVAEHGYYKATYTIILVSTTILAVIFHNTACNGLSRIANEVMEKNKQKQTE